jgi:Kdo2-lipid IVA lauroyltransferase/acyltransferase
MMARPAGVPFTKDLIWRLEALAFDLFGATTRLWPTAWGSAAGGRLFRLLGPLTSAHRVAERNIRLAFPYLDRRARARLLSEQWDAPSLNCPSATG